MLKGKEYRKHLRKQVKKLVVYIPLCIELKSLDLKNKLNLFFINLSCKTHEDRLFYLIMPLVTTINATCTILTFKDFVLARIHHWNKRLLKTSTTSKC